MDDSNIHKTALKPSEQRLLNTSLDQMAFPDSYFCAYGRFMYWFTALDRLFVWMGEYTELGKDAKNARLLVRLTAVQEHCFKLQSLARGRGDTPVIHAAQSVLEVALRVPEMQVMRNKICHSGTLMARHMYPGDRIAYLGSAAVFNAETVAHDIDNSALMLRSMCDTLIAAGGLLNMRPGGEPKGID